MRTVAVLAVAMLGVSACSDSDGAVDYAAWEAELANASGYPIPNFSAIQEQTEDACGQSDSDFALYVALGVDRGAEKALRTSMSYACPERVGEIDDVVNNSAIVDEICRERADWGQPTRRNCRLLGVTAPERTGRPSPR
jgi:hypothetical protein